MSKLELQLHCLPAAQRRVWDELGSVPSEFTLCGGTALALMLGHRRSVDFDFFAYSSIDPEKLRETMPLLERATIIQQETNTLTAEVKRGGPVRVSFFGVPKLKCIQLTRPLTEPRIRLASPIDLAGMKAAVITRRIEIKDYLDLHALFTQTSLTLLDALAAASQIYGSQFNPVLSLKALGDLEPPPLAKLPTGVKRRLREIISAIDLKTLANRIENRKLSKSCRLTPISRPCR